MLAADRRRATLGPAEPAGGTTLKRCPSSPRSAGRAPADGLGPGALMTNRLERCGVHVSGQRHGPTAKTVGERERQRGRERASGFSCRPVRRRLGPWIVSHHAPPLSPNRPQMNDVKSKEKKKTERRDVGGTLYNLKGFHPVK